ncbi:hypothetical protein [Microbacterium sp.]|uniref:hypothetical protein n=1 Tax=Microbacterium sp. TaxID=51671 RepID=UPI00260F9830|nr:hypothetical protein [Microbacterium sp.]
MTGRMQRASAVGAALALTAVAFTGCAAASESPSCEEVMAQASYEVMSQLAAAGVASDPAELRAAMPREVTDDVDERPEVTLPSYEVFTTEYSDAEQATLRSALTSASVGVGEVFDAEQLYSTMAAHGVCEGELP